MTTDPEELLAQLEQRILELEARDEIQSMHAAFVRSVADRRFGDLVESFTDDAVIDMRTHGPKSGHASIAEHFQHMADVPLDGASYLLSSPVITVTGDTATGVWTWHRFYSSGEVSGRQIAIWGVWDEGRYDCEYARVGGRWRFSRMRFRIVRPTPDSDGAPPT